MMKLSDIEDAFFFVAGASYGEHSAMINKKTGKVYYQSEMGDLDEIPEEIDEPDSWVEVPLQNDLGLGRELVLFVPSVNAFNFQSYPIDKRRFVNLGE